MSRTVLRNRRNKRLRIVGAALPTLLAGLLTAFSAHSIAPVEGVNNKALELASRFAAPELQVAPTQEAAVQISQNMARPYAAAAAFQARHPGTWEMRWDSRADRPNLVQGSGVPLVPGSGNSLTVQSLGLRAGETIDLAVVEARLQDFIVANSDFLKTGGLDFALDPNGSVGYGEGNTHWFVEFVQVKDGVRVKGANLFFRVSHGNIVQFGTNMVAPVATDTIATSTREKAFDMAFAELGLPAGAAVSEWLNQGELMLLPAAMESGFAAGTAYTGARGTGYSHRLVWQFAFRVKDDAITYEVLVDAKTNRIIQARDMTSYVNATVDGGVFLGLNTGPETIVALSYAAVTNGTAKVTDALGIYDYSSGTATTALDGKYYRMSDGCGSISLSNSTDGNLHLGTDPSTDCGDTTSGGAGNTRASRTGFYHLNKINRKAVSFLPSNSWLASKVTANMNVNQVCNASWNGSSMNYYKSGSSGSTSCGNTGEIPAVFLHEWGHGMDQNSGGAASGDNGSGEAVGDTFAMLETKDACIGMGFYTQPGKVCYNCENSCSGVRDHKTFSLVGQSGARVVAKPSTITANNGPDCDRSGYTCPTSGYQGPMGYEGHCEAYISGSANWDLAQSLVAAHGSTAGWAAMDKIWYASLTPSKSAYQVASGGQCNTAATVNGCGSNNWYTVYLAADDNDGNLANGTPNACRIWDAFNAHGIACGTRPTCSGGGTNVPPVANFSSSVSGLTANFTDSSTDSDGTIASRSWNFGDGSTSTATNPSHTYASAGTYTVTLTVTDNAAGTNAKTASVTVTSTPGNVPPVANFSSSVAGLTATFTDTSTDSDGTIASRNWNFGDGTSSTATNPSKTYTTAGTYTVTLTVTDNSGATNTKTGSVTVTAPPTSNELQNGVAKTGLSIAQGQNLQFTMVVPAGATGLKFVTSGGSGDADLYVKFGSPASTTVYDCKSEGSTTAETCNIATAQAGTYNVYVYGYSAVSGMSITGSYTTGGGGGGTVLQNGVPKTGLSGSTGTSQTFTLVVPAGATNLKFVTSGGTGDMDMYVKFGSAPTTSSYDCRPYTSGNAETCTITTAQAGTYYVMLRAYSTYSGVSLTGSFTP